MPLRWFGFALALVVPGIALANLPQQNAVGEFWSDQWTAARWYGLPPHVWSIVVASLAVVGTVALVWRTARMPAMPAPELPDLPPARHRRWLFALIALLVVFYAPGFGAEFGIYDDPQNIWGSNVVSHLNWPNFRHILFENYHGVNQEWMFLSLQLCYAAFGKNYAGFFALNLALFPVLLLLVHAFAFELTKNRAIALLATAFFGLNPAVAELLCWMLERGHYFGLIFALASCVSYLRYVDRRQDPSSRRWRWFALALLAFAGSQMGKPIFLYVPVWLVLFDVWRGRRDFVRAAVEKLPFALIGVLFLRKIVAGGEKFGRVEHEYLGGSVSNTLALDTNLVLEYLRSAFLPYQTGPQVPWNDAGSWLYVTGVPNVLVHGFSPLASLVILACLVISAAAIARAWGWPVLLLAVVGGAVSVATVMNLPAHTVVTAYRYTLSMRVLASIVLAAAVVRAVAGAEPSPARWRRLAPALAAAAWLLVSGWNANATRAAWKDPASLWTRNAELYPYDGWSHYYAGKALQLDHRWDECVAHLKTTRRRLPGHQMADRRMGDCLYGARDMKAAAKHWDRFFSEEENQAQIDRSYARKLREVGLGALVPDRLRDSD